VTHHLRSDVEFSACDVSAPKKFAILEHFEFQGFGVGMFTLSSVHCSGSRVFLLGVGAVLGIELMSSRMLSYTPSPM
jgi:hypothetical protein